MSDKRNTRGVQETKELIRAIRTVQVEAAELTQPGEKVTGARLFAKILRTTPELKAALEGVRNVPLELSELTRDEFMKELGPDLLALQYDIYEALVGKTV